jgi:hypothetical protein
VKLLTVGRGKNDVGVQEENMGSSRRFDTDITGTAEAEVLIALDQAGVWRRHSDYASRVVVRAVVNDDELGIRKRILHRRETTADARGRVVGHDDS